MELFRSGQLDVLVATTVIEVGVDVPNATVMVIEDADRFGIAQLHQLRGRVGRGADESFCFLLWRAPGEDEERADAEARLGAIEKSTDGFELAEIDPNDGIFRCDANGVYKLKKDYGKGVTLADVGKSMSDLK